MRTQPASSTFMRPGNGRRLLRSSVTHLPVRSLRCSAPAAAPGRLTAESTGPARMPAALACR